MKLANFKLLILFFVFGLNSQCADAKILSSNEIFQESISLADSNEDFFDGDSGHDHKSIEILGWINNLTISVNSEKNNFLYKLQYFYWDTHNKLLYKYALRIKNHYAFIYAYKFNERLNLFPFHSFL